VAGPAARRLIMTGQKGKNIMKFIATNINTEDKREVYRMTKGDSLKVQDMDRGTSFPVEKYALYEDTKTRKKNDGSLEEYTEKVLTIVSGNAKLGTISATFIKSFMEIVDIMGADPFAIIITGGKSKNGREYVNCELDCDYDG
jgi:hypothetical protein